MQTFAITLAAALISLATFYSGFGLGTLLMPAMAFFVPIEQAIAATAVAHLGNNLFKLAAVGRYADRPTLKRFGIPAVAAAFAGAAVLTTLDRLAPIYSATWTGRPVDVTPIKLAAAILILFFATFELIPALRRWSLPPRYMPLGGLLSGFFGGLSGHQGAFRSAFLLRAELSKEAFIGTGVVIACAVDLARLAIYLTLGTGTFSGLSTHAHHEPWRWDLLAAACIGAIVGSLIAGRWLEKTTLNGVRSLSAAVMIFIALAIFAAAI